MGAKGEFAFTKIIVDDIDRPAAFYKTVFGFHEVFRIKEAVTPERPIEELMLSLADSETSKEPPLVLFKFLEEDPPKGSDVIIGLIVPDIKRTFELVQENGGSVVRWPQEDPPRGIICGFATDCDGRLLEIIQMMG